MPTTTMNDSDRVQTWISYSNHRATEAGGPVALKITEILDFDKRVMTSHAVGSQEGERVNEIDTLTINANVVPEKSAEFRRTHGYTRIA